MLITSKGDFVFASLFTRLEAFRGLTLVNIGCFIISPDVNDAGD